MIWAIGVIWYPADEAFEARGLLNTWNTVNIKNAMEDSDLLVTDANMQFSL